MRLNSSITVLAIVMIFVEISSAGVANDSRSRYKKTWDFNMARGTVSIGVVSPTDSQSRPLPPSLEMFYQGEPNPALTDEVGFVRQVLRDLSSLDIDPRTIVAINMRGPAEPEVKRRLAVAALNSQEWHNLTTKASGNAELIMEHSLDTLRPYDLLNEALEEYGLRVKSVGAEKVAGAKCLALGIPDLPCRADHNPRLPAGANLSIALEKVGGPGTDGTFSNFFASVSPWAKAPRMRKPLAPNRALTTRDSLIRISSSRHSI